MAFLDFSFLDNFFDRYLLDNFCGVALLVIIVLVLTAYVIRRRRWDKYIDMFGEQLHGEERERFIKRIRRSILNTNLSAIAVLVVLTSAFLFTMAFVFNIIGEWVWTVFIVIAIIILGIQVWLIYSLSRLPVLDEERYSYIYEFVRSICEKFEMRVPMLKMEDNIEINAYTTSFFGRGSVIVITKGLLQRQETDRISTDHILAIIGHEIGHMVNHDATIVTVLNPLMMFVMGVKNVLELIVRGILFFIISTGRWGSRGILNLLIAIGLVVMMGVLLFYVGVIYVTFYLVTLAVSVCWLLLSRQKEYAADLFGSLASGSRVTMGISLMELTRETGFEEVKLRLTKKALEEKIEKGETCPKDEAPQIEENEVRVPAVEVARTVEGQSDEQVEETVDEKISKMSTEDKMAVYDSIDAYQAATDDPEVLDMVSMRDARHLCEKGIEAFTKEDFLEFSAFEYSIGEKARELMLSHPLFGKRVKGLTLIPVSAAGDAKATSEDSQS